MAVCRRNHSSLQRRRLESDAEDRCSHGSCRRNHSSLRQGKLESDAEDRCRYDRSRRNYSSLQLRKLESDASDRCRHERSRRNHSSLQLRKLESDAEDRCHYERSRRNHSSVTLQKLESDAEDCRYEIHQAKPFFCDATKIRIGRGRSLPLRNQQAKPFSPASIRKSGPEIRNQCTQEGLNGKNLHRFASLGLKSRIDARMRA